MDVFKEQIVKGNLTAKDYIFSMFFTLIAVLLSAICFKFFNLYGLIIAGIAMYAAWWLSTGRNVEYEYVFTNGDMDVDKIIAKRSRKHLIAFDCKDVEIIAPVSEKYKSRINDNDIRKKFFAASSMNAEGLFFCIFNKENMGDVILFFEPNEMMLNAMRTYAQKKLFTE